MTREEKMKALLTKESYRAEDLITVVEFLRAPGGCPWDREQTHKSLRGGMIEETYEVIEAIDSDDPVLLCEELGDVFLQLVMHAEIAKEEGAFDFHAVADGICKKMILRHPHVFGEVKADTVEAVLSNWDAIKGKEKSRNTVTEKLNSIPRQFPALMRAAKVGKKAKMLDFPNAEAIAAKIEEELAEVRAAAAEGARAHLEEEVGDLLFAAASLARKLEIDPEEALTRATDKFIDRFSHVEESARARGESLEELSERELDQLWEMAKKSKKLQ